ncbi:type II toxin-antitoxin system RelB/DinJ family antitoxin [Rhodopseudomonas sp. BR0M22]|uniref:type II toxin-antitoxin system RelB/DinJ family antitoxin n=1 Tax=Rhodopseudomonas sp. BR0M22 TaxID=2269369 RepID=UPI0013DF0971|nr:type II toxin-antitoxin system RelB/DinJ family antitoxin [Rhodopseudomonas sp. BR0M22]NEW93054.1 type II toxin-antitoxin system RelB/DinJ family antitoxin [Rhodopseudomonas sp. BR0M22]
MAAKTQTKTPRSPAKRDAKTAGKTAARKPVKSGYINARVEPKLKKSAEAVLDKIGLSTTDAVTMFLKQVVAHKGMPFPVKIPNKETIRALRDAERGRVTRFSGTTEEFFAHLDKTTR